MDDKIGGLLFLALGIFIGAVVFSGGCAQRDFLKREAIANNFAEYNPTNGNWQWKTNTSN